MTVLDISINFSTVGELKSYNIMQARAILRHMAIFFSSRLFAKKQPSFC